MSVISRKQELYARIILATRRYDALRRGCGLEDSAIPSLTQEVVDKMTVTRLEEWHSNVLTLIVLTGIAYGRWA